MDFERKIHDEILQTLERRSRIDIAKLSFVTGLFSVGVIGKIPYRGETDIALFGTLYLAPFVALAFDCFALRETWSLHRIGLFLQQSDCEEERAFEIFLAKGRFRNPFYHIGLAGITFMTIAVSAWLLYFQKSAPKASWSWQNHDLAWMTVSVIFFVIIDVAGGLYMFCKLRNKKETSTTEGLYRFCKLRNKKAASTKSQPR